MGRATKFLFPTLGAVTIFVGIEFCAALTYFSVLTALFAAAGYFFRATRNVEDDLPDHDLITSDDQVQQVVPAA